MATLAPVDRLEIQVLVDNATDGLSSTPPNVENEFAFATRRGLRASSARCLCCAVHGFSALLTATRGGNSHSVLFDSGPEDFAFDRNCIRFYGLRRAQPDRQPLLREAPYVFPHRRFRD